MITYWCAILKTNYPKEFFVACLRNPKNESETIHLLREMKNEGIDFKPVDPHNPTLDWEVVNGVIVGGLVNIKGVGGKKAANIIERLKEGVELTKSQREALENPITPYDDLYECTTRYGKYYEDPKQYELNTESVFRIGEMPRIEYEKLTILGKVIDVKIRQNTDNQDYCSMVVEDDTGKLYVTFPAKQYKNLAIDFVKDGYYAIKGQYNKEYDRMFGSSAKRLDGVSGKT